MDREEKYERLRTASAAEQPATTIELSKVYLARHPDDFGALMHYGMALQSIARYAEAMTAYERALACASADAQVLVYRQIGLLEQDRAETTSAEAAFMRAIAARPGDAAGYIYLGALLAKAGRLEEAERAHRTAIACTDGPRDEAYLNLGLVLRGRERYLDALECFRAAVALDPEYAEAQEALEDVEQVLFYFPEA